MFVSVFCFGVGVGWGVDFVNYLWEYVSMTSHTYRVGQSTRREGGVIAIDRVEERIKWVGARSMKRAIEIVCVYKSMI